MRTEAPALMTGRVAVPSRGRLRDVVLGLLEEAGFGIGGFRGIGARVAIDGLEFIEMRPRDAAGWLAAGRIDGGFISTDLVLEEGLTELSRWLSVLPGPILLLRAGVTMAG